MRMKQFILFLALLSLLYSRETDAFLHLKTSVFTRSKLMSTTAPEILTKDGGVVKELLLVGKGKIIETGDILAVEYAAYLAVRYILTKNRPFSVKRNITAGLKETICFR